MRPIESENSYLRAPLDQILGYPANIRLLRSLVKTGNGMSVSTLAKHTGLSVPGVHKVVDRLLGAGIIKQVGSGKTQLVVIREEHPMAQTLLNLFRVEQQAFDSLKSKLKALIKKLKIQPKSAWIYGNVAAGVDKYGDPLKIALLGDLKHVDKIVREFKELLRQEKIESRFDVTIELHPVTLADRQELNVKDHILLYGPNPMFFAMSTKTEGLISSHSDLDAKALKNSLKIGEFLSKHPEVINKTIKYLNQYLHSEQSGVKNEMIEWRNILESTSMQRLKKILESDSERSIRLRQSLPFWFVLDEKEKEELKSIE